MKEKHKTEPLLVVARGKELLEFVWVAFGVVIHGSICTEGKALALIFGEKIEEDVEPQSKCEQTGGTQGNRIVAAAMFLVPLAICEDVIAGQLIQVCLTDLLLKQVKLKSPPPGGIGIQVLALPQKGLNSGV